jgi:hypothetical protein
MATTTTFRDLVGSVLPGPFLQRLSGGFFGVLHGLTGDILADALSVATRMPWLRDPSSPDDVLPLVGSERSLPRYPIETAVQYRTRLLEAWESYRFAGAEQTIERQFEIAGYPGVDITFDAAALGPNGEAAPYWSQFWVYFPYSSGHPVTGDGAEWGSFDFGDGTVYGLDVTLDFYSLIHGVVRKWKPTRWICRGFIFELADTSTAELAFGI